MADDGGSLDVGSFECRKKDGGLTRGWGANMLIPTYFIIPELEPPVTSQASVCLAASRSLYNTLSFSSFMGKSTAPPVMLMSILGRCRFHTFSI